MTTTSEDPLQLLEDYPATIGAGRAEQLSALHEASHTSYASGRRTFQYIKNLGLRRASLASLGPLPVQAALDEDVYAVEDDPEQQ